VLLGSTAEHVVRQAPCPVLVVREHEREFLAEKGVSEELLAAGCQLTKTGVR
jgi:universal stress protein family protein